MAEVASSTPFSNWQIGDKPVKGVADNLSVENSNEVYRRMSASTNSISRVPQYHDDKHAEYVLPNDFPEHIRLAAQAVHLSAMMNNRLFHAPLDASEPIHMLDIGCGTGIVTNDMAAKFPNAECFGLDISAIPDVHTHDTRIHFLQGNALSQKPSQWTDQETGSAPFTKDEGVFDYIFSRLQVLGMHDWPKFIQTEFSLLKPGGYAEVHDVDWEYLDGNGKAISDDWAWNQILEKSWTSKGMDMHCASKAKDWMAESGFQDIQTFQYVWPFHSGKGASKETIAFADFTVTSQPEMIHHALERAMEGQASQEEIEKMQAEMRRDNQAEPGKHKIFTVTVGRKPS